MILKKFQDPYITADGLTRAKVDLTKLETLWFNTGSLCNITCKNCYMESSPLNDTLAYLTLADVIQYLNELDNLRWKIDEVAFTGGEPFMNKDIYRILRHLCNEKKINKIVICY